MIIDVKTIYTGGGIYEYIAETDQGTWMMFDDECLQEAFVPVVDREPTEDDWRSEFFEEHDAGYLVNGEAVEAMREVLQEAAFVDEADRERRLAILGGEA